MDNNSYIAIILVVIGAALLGFIFFQRKKHKRLLATGTKVGGVVFDYASDNTGSSSVGENSNFPLIRFVTAQDEWITEKYNIGYPSFILKKGQLVDVFYNPEKPADFILNLKADKWIAYGAVVIAVSCFAVAIGLFYHFKSAAF